GDWKIIVDPYENGYYDYRWQPRDQSPSPSRDAYFMDAKPRDPSDLVEYDFDASPSLRVPGDWNTQSRELYYYEGTVWYRTKFTPAGSGAGERIFLRFGAVNYRADVYLNGSKLGFHLGGFTPFSFEVTGRLKAGENSLVVKVDNKRSADGVPTLNTDWWNYGGITRDVTLVRVPARFIASHFLHLESEQTGAIAGEVQVEGAGAGEQVRVQIPELGQDLQAATDASGRAVFHFTPAGLRLWSPETPKLYDVRFQCGGDAVKDQIGFRTIRTRGRQILLNGRPIFLRGVAIHDELALGGGGRVTTEAQSEQLLRWAQELGCNFVRLAHYPHNENTIRLADRLGLLVWAETPVYWTIAWENPDTYRNAEEQLSDLIRRDRERASVIIWSVANETPVTEARTRFLSRLIARARALDGTRLVSAAMEQKTDPARPGWRIVRDPLEAYTDLASFNEYIGWYYGTVPADIPAARWDVPQDKPIIISEFGGGALQGRHGPATERWTEEFQAELYRQTLPMLDRLGVAGMSPWILVDFRSPRRPLPGVQDGFNRKGLVSSDGVKKQAFFVLQRYYAAKAAAAK
ncbi:MAG TPA: glycoside hydrolase family 2 TIM barrel-domain containing protein, partial [Opitutaceae bacterium]|nr:glycoside hydrolase family 2 TIM barrel-domain containing protein [Opitutaceae bacterium]